MPTDGFASASDRQSRGLSSRSVRFVVIGSGLLDRAVLGLLHRLGQGDALTGRLGKVARAQSVRREFLRIEASFGAAALEDQVNRLRGERPVLDRTPAINRSEDRA